MPRFTVSAEVEINFDPIYADDENMASKAMETILEAILETLDIAAPTEYTHVNITNVEEEDE